MNKSPAKRKLKADSKYTLEKAEAICKMLSETACSIEACAAHVGIHRDTLYHWKNTQPEFAQMLTRAYDLAEAFLTRKALAGGKGSGTAMWFLERRFKRRYAMQQQPPPAPVDNSVNVLAVLERLDVGKLRELAGGTAADEPKPVTPLKLVG